MIEKLLTTQETATLLGTSMSFLERDRWAGAKIPFIKIGSRSVRYRQADIETYISNQVKHSTSQA